MPNMSYCRFRNTLQDLRDCHENIYDVDDMDEEEKKAREQLIEECKEIAREFEEDED